MKFVQVPAKRNKHAPADRTAAVETPESIVRNIHELLDSFYNEHVKVLKAIRSELVVAVSKIRKQGEGTAVKQYDESEG